MRICIVLGMACVLFSGCTTLDSNTVMTINNRLTAIEEKLDSIDGQPTLRGKKSVPVKNATEGLEIEVPVKIKVLMDVETETNEVKNDGK